MSENAHTAQIRSVKFQLLQYIMFIFIGELGKSYEILTGEPTNLRELLIAAIFLTESYTEPYKTKMGQILINKTLGFYRSLKDMTIIAFHLFLVRFGAGPAL